MDVIFNDVGDENEYSIDEYVNRPKKEQNTKTHGFASDEIETIESINMSHLKTAIIWDYYTHDKEYAVNLQAIVIKKIKLIPKKAFNKLKCKANEPLDMKMLDSKVDRPKIINNGLCALQHILDSIINIDMFKKI